MKLHHLVIDDFLDHFDYWREWADAQEYRDEVSPVDGVIYPGICRVVPSWGIEQRLNAIMNVPVRINALFARLSVQGVNPPHFAHNDASMGQWSLMIYLNRPEHCRGGTALLRHRELGFSEGPRTDEEMAAWLQDTNKLDVWDELMFCPMRPNRAFIFRAELMHGAQPHAGFGKDATDGRLVLTAFFDT